jgi:hypothetical protein
MKYQRERRGMKRVVLAGLLAFASMGHQAWARDVEYSRGDGEVDVWVNPGEPTEITFPAAIKDGFKNSNAGLALERKGASLVVFGKENMSENGEKLLVRAGDNSYSIRVRRATSDNPADSRVDIGDGKGPLGEAEEELPPSKERRYDYAPASKVSGLMREMVLAAEFGKKSIPGYQTSEKYKGETIVSDGAILAKVDKIFIGPNLWGYVLDTTNLLDQTQKVNPATFRIDGTRAVSASQWELAPRPVNVEEQISNKHNTKVYIVTRAK